MLNISSAFTSSEEFSYIFLASYYLTFINHLKKKNADNDPHFTWWTFNFLNSFITAYF